MCDPGLDPGWEKKTDINDWDHWETLNVDYVLYKLLYEVKFSECDS